MKYFIAGISLDEEFKQLLTQNFTEFLSRDIANFIPQIVAQATQEMGDDVIVIINLYEYELTNCMVDKNNQLSLQGSSLTGQSINKETKDKALKILQSAIAGFENVILVPGSFAYYAPINAQEKDSTIEENYKIMKQTNSMLAADTHFIFEDENRKAMNERDLTVKYYLQNSSYILAKDKKYKRKKTFPYMERNKLSDTIFNNSIFYIGAATPIQPISVSNQSINMNLLICRDIYNSFFSHTLAQTLDVCVVVSNTLNTLNTTQFMHYGALTIHMDYKSNLTVYKDEAHPKAQNIQEVTARLYVRKPDVYHFIEAPIVILNPSPAELTPTIERAANAEETPKRKWGDEHLTSKDEDQLPKKRLKIANNEFLPVRHHIFSDNESDEEDGSAYFLDSYYLAYNDGLFSEDAQAFTEEDGQAIRKLGK